MCLGVEIFDFTRILSFFLYFFFSCFIFSPSVGCSELLFNFLYVCEHQLVNGCFFFFFFLKQFKIFGLYFVGFYFFVFIFWLVNALSTVQYFWCVL